MDQLIVARALQGLGAGGLIPPSQAAIAVWAPAMAMLSEAAEVEGVHQGFAFALANLAWALGQVAGSGGGGALAKVTSDAVALMAVVALCLLTLAAVHRAPSRAPAGW